MKRIIALLFLCAMIWNCSSDSSDSGQDGAPINQDGQGGSLATFTLKGDYLYVVDQFDLNVFQLNDVLEPVFVNKVAVGFDIETLFGYKDYLYIGSTTGMFIYSLNNPEFPTKLSRVQHFTACDPVVANDTHAFVTLHSDTFCGNDINLLEIYDVRDVTNPILISSRNLIFPRGLGLFGNYLIVCDDEIKVFDVSDPKQSKLVNSIDRQAFDVIISDNLLIAIGETGLFQYKLDPSEGGISFTELSSIQI
nr:hypothetical protein [Allomuricauda sp.]